MKKMVVVINGRLYEKLREKLGVRKIYSFYWDKILREWADFVNNVVQEKYEPRQLIVQVSDETYEDFMKAVKKAYGDKRGAISKAVEGAIKAYVFRKDSSKNGPSS